MVYQKTGSDFDFTIRNSYQLAVSVMIDYSYSIVYQANGRPVMNPDGSRQREYIPLKQSDLDKIQKYIANLADGRPDDQILVQNILFDNKASFLKEDINWKRKQQLTGALFSGLISLIFIIIFTLILRSIRLMIKRMGVSKNNKEFQKMCQPLSADDQIALEGFLEVMYSSRGFQFDPAGLHSDIRNINEVYKKSGGDFWIIKDNNRIIGSIALKIINKNDKIGEIKRYFVLPDYQGQGFGKILMEWVIKESKKRNLKRLRLDTMKNSVKALSIFRKYGFYEVPKYNNNDLAEIFMEMKI
jgi:ribosomal protein S18 acetylase RimI-like enzyme